MVDATEWILAALVIVLGGAAFAVGGQVIRDAWRNGFQAAPQPAPAQTLLVQSSTTAGPAADADGVAHPGGLVTSAIRPQRLCNEWGTARTHPDRTDAATSVRVQRRATRTAPSDQTTQPSDPRT